MTSMENQCTLRFELWENLFDRCGCRPRWNCAWMTHFDYLTVKALRLLAYRVRGIWTSFVGDNAIAFSGPRRRMGGGWGE